MPLTTSVATKSAAAETSTWSRTFRTFMPAILP
jgi:hypothetical protein